MRKSPGSSGKWDPRPYFHDKCGQSTYNLEMQWETLVRHWFFLHLVSNGNFWFHKSQGSTYSSQRVYCLRIIYINSSLLPPGRMQFSSINREACQILCFLLFNFFSFLFSCCLQENTTHLKRHMQFEHERIEGAKRYQRVVWGWIWAKYMIRMNENIRKKLTILSNVELSMIFNFL